MFRTFLFAFTLMFGIAAFADDMQILEYKYARTSELTRQYVAATGEALYLMNYRLSEMKQKPLYCPPENIRLMTVNYVNVLDEEIRRQSHKKSLILQSVADVLLDGLIRSFPCK